MNRNQATQLQRDWLEACEQVGIPAIITEADRIYKERYPGRNK